MADEQNPAFVGRFGSLNRLLDALNSVRASLVCMRERADALRKQSGYDFAFDQYGECVGRLSRPWQSKSRNGPVGTIDLCEWRRDVRLALAARGEDPGDVSPVEIDDAAAAIASDVGRLDRFDMGSDFGRSATYEFAYYKPVPQWCRKLSGSIAKANQALDEVPQELLDALDRLQQTAWRPRVRLETLDPSQHWTAAALVDDRRELPEDVLRKAFIDKARTPESFETLNGLVENLAAYQRQLVAARGETPSLDTPEAQQRAGLHECRGVVAWLISQLGCVEWYAKRADEYGSKITKAVTRGSMEEWCRGKQREEARQRDTHKDAIRNALGAEELRAWFDARALPWTAAGVRQQRGVLIADRGMPAAEVDGLTLGEFLERLRGEPLELATDEPPVGTVALRQRIDQAHAAPPASESPTIEALDALEKTTPSINREDGSWVTNKLAARIDGLEPRTLANYRREGQKTADGMFGRDKDGRIWRRLGTPSSHPCYLRSTLRSDSEP